MSNGPSLAETLESAGWEIQDALEGTEEFLGPNGLDIFDGEVNKVGGNVVLAMTKTRDGKIGYHVRKEKAPDKKGNCEAFDYFFGDREPEVVYSRFHTSHRFNRYTQPPFDTQDTRPMKKRDADKIRRIIGVYCLLRDSE